MDKVKLLLQTLKHPPITRLQKISIEVIEQLQADKAGLIEALKLIAEGDDKQIREYCEKNNIFCGWMEMQTFCNIAHAVIRKYSTQEG